MYSLSLSIIKYKMKLIKISDDHYIVVDDSEIEEGDFVYVNCSELEVKEIRKVSGYYNEQYLFEGGGQIHIDYCKKITYTTDININELYYIPLEEVKELIGEVDVEKKAINSWEGCDGCDANDELFFINGYQKGYNQALQDNKDKKYTEEDMINAFREGTNAGALHERLSDYDNGDYEEAEQYSEQYEESFIQSLQPKTEWEIEEIDGKFKLK